MNDLFAAGKKKTQQLETTIVHGDYVMSENMSKQESYFIVFESDIALKQSIV